MTTLTLRDGQLHGRIGDQSFRLGLYDRRSDGWQRLPLQQQGDDFVAEDGGTRARLRLDGGAGRYAYRLELDAAQPNRLTLLLEDGGHPPAFHLVPGRIGAGQVTASLLANPVGHFRGPESDRRRIRSFSLFMERSFHKKEN
jgi:hypothetical protein